MKEGSERGWMLPHRVSSGTESQVERERAGEGSEEQGRGNGPRARGGVEKEKTRESCIRRRGGAW